MSEFDEQLEIVFNSIQRRKHSREYLTSLTPEEKIAILVEWQEKYYQIFVLTN
jgi:hypothetical protein